MNAHQCMHIFSPYFLLWASFTSNFVFCFCSKFFFLARIMRFQPICNIFYGMHIQMKDTISITISIHKKKWISRQCISCLAVSIQIECPTKKLHTFLCPASKKRLSFHIGMIPIISHRSIIISICLLSIYLRCETRIRREENWDYHIGTPFEHDAPMRKNELPTEMIFAFSLGQRARIEL